MQVAITCRHGHISDDIQKYISSKAEKLLTYFERVTAIEVTVNFENGQVKVEVLVNTEHRHNFVASDLGTDVVVTFDRALHKMEQQIKKYKQKIQDHRRDRPVNEVVETEAGETGPAEERG